jgi:hypothetical protein
LRPLTIVLTSGRAMGRIPAEVRVGEEAAQ